VEQREAASYCSFHDGRGVPGVCGRRGKACGSSRRSGRLSSCFPLKGPVVVECDNNAAFHCAKTVRRGSVSTTLLSFITLLGIIWLVVSCLLCIKVLLHVSRT
jgi:hypothetical protein